MTQLKKAFVYAIPDTGWINTDIDIMFDEIKDNDAFEETGMSDDLINDIYNNDDTEARDWLRDKAVELYQYKDVDSDKSENEYYDQLKKEVTSKELFISFLANVVENPSDVIEEQKAQQRFVANTKELFLK